MYQKVLVPLDDSEASRSVLKALSGLVADGGEAILLHVIPPGKTRGTGNFAVMGYQVEEDHRNKALVHLNRVSNELNEASIKATVTVMVSNSVVGCIVNFAEEEGVDLIAMYTHGRKGIAKLLKGSVTQDVRAHTSVEVQGFADLELAQIGAP
jgi:nucleotide-binding universal stress UspA family protein